MGGTDGPSPVLDLAVVIAGPATVAVLSNSSANVVKCELVEGGSERGNTNPV